MRIRARHKDCSHDWAGGKARALALLTALVVCLAGPPPVGAANWDDLANREIAVEPLKRPDGVRGVRLTFLVEATRKEIWAALVDYENFTQIFYDVQKISVLDQDRAGASVAYSVNAVLIDVNYVLYRQYELPETRLTWKKVSGDLKRVEGSWTIKDTASGQIKLMVYESFVDVGGILPGWLVRRSAIDKATQMAARLRNWIEGKPMADPHAIEESEVND